MQNKSSRPIYFVVMDPDGNGTSFGWFGVGGKGGTAAGCFVPLRRDLVLQWQEDEVTRRVTLDLSMYRSKRSKIESFGFYYVGDGRWIAEARSGTLSDAAIVKP